MRIAVMLVVALVSASCSKTSKEEPPPIDCTAERPRVAAAWNALVKWAADREKRVDFKRADGRMVAEAMKKLDGPNGANAVKVVAATDAEVAAAAALVKAGDEAAKAWQGGDSSKHAAAVLAAKAYAAAMHDRHQLLRTTQAGIQDDMVDSAKYMGSDAVAKATEERKKLGNEIKMDKPDSELMLAELAKLETVATTALACK